MGLVDSAMAGERRAIARLATHIENDDELAWAAMERLYPRTGRARLVGVTGPPGAGKSSLVNLLIVHWRARGQRVAVIAVDPTSPLSGGAVLGDRIRMLEHGSDDGVFLRSCASRRGRGGLPDSTAGLIHLFDAVGYDLVLVETVGVGQEETDIMHYVETVVLVQAPGFGDGVQALKAGVLEIADVYAVNKADLPGAQETARELRAMLSLALADREWSPPVISVSSKERNGIEELARSILNHQSWSDERGETVVRRRRIAEKEIWSQFQRRLARQSRSDMDDRLGDAIEAVANRTSTPRFAAGLLLARSVDPASSD